MTDPDHNSEISKLLNGNGNVDVKALQSWLWEAASTIRGAVDAPKFKDYILPLVFLKRLSDVFDDEIHRLAGELGDEATARRVADGDHKLVRFYLPPNSDWSTVRALTTSVGQRLTEILRGIAKENPRLQGVIDVVDFNATVSGQRVIEDQRLIRLIESLSRHRLGLEDVEPDILGRAYEYLLRKFAEGQGQSAGEFFTPKEVGWLMAELVDPKEGESFYDPAAGSSGLLIKPQLLLRYRKGDVKKPLRLFGQELLPSTYAISKMNMFIHDMEGEIALGDTLRNPRFSSRGRLDKFDVVVANPMWNQDGYTESFYDSDPFGQFAFGRPYASSADWGWIQHMLASLEDAGRAAIVLDTNAVNRGSGAVGKQNERDIRKTIVEADLIEAVILLPENLFYNTGSPGIIVVLSKDKPAKLKNKILLINASQEFLKGAPKNFLPPEAIAKVVDAYRNQHDVSGFAYCLSLQEARDLDYDLSPSRHVVPRPRERTVSLDDAQAELRGLETKHEASLEKRRKALSLFQPAAAEDLTGDSELGPVPGSWGFVSIDGLVAEEKSGDWGKGEAENGDDYVLCRVVKGTNFADVDALRVDGLVERYIKRKTYERKKLEVGDLLVEMSGGGKYQATGRVLYLSEDLLKDQVTPIYYSNFLKRLRLDPEKANARFVYHYWKLLYLLGRTERYERQPTQIRNFKHANFMAGEKIPNLPLGQQEELAEVLDTLTHELLDLEDRLEGLRLLHGVAMFDLLTGQYEPKRES